jgi:hypothetical protein
MNQFPKTICRSNSARQSEKQTTPKRFQNSFRGITGQFLWKITPWITFRPFDLFSQIVYTKQVNSTSNTQQNLKIHTVLFWGSTREFSNKNYLEHALFYWRTLNHTNTNAVQSTFADLTPIVSTWKLPPHHFCLVHIDFTKTSNIDGRKLLSLKTVVRTRRSCKRAIIIWRTRHVRPRGADVLTNASKVIGYTLCTLSCKWH